MRVLAHLARVHARFLARFEQRAALAVEALAALFVLAHVRDRGFEPPARLARLLAIGGELLLDLARARRRCAFMRSLRAVDAAALALQLAGDFRQTAMRSVELALRIVARLLGFDALALAGFAPLRRAAAISCFELRDAVRELADFALARDHADLRARRRAARARNPAPSHSPVGVTTDSPSPSRAATSRASSSDRAVRTRASMRRAAAGPCVTRGQRALRCAGVGVGRRPSA